MGHQAQVKKQRRLARAANKAASELAATSISARGTESGAMKLVKTTREAILASFQKKDSTGTPES